MVTVTGVDDDVDDDDIGYTIVTAAASGGDYAGLNAEDVSVTNQDDDAVGITVTPTTGLAWRSSMLLARESTLVRKLL